MRAGRVVAIRHGQLEENAVAEEPHHHHPSSNVALARVPKADSNWTLIPASARPHPNCSLA